MHPTLMEFNIQLEAQSVQIKIGESNTRQDLIHCQREGAMRMADPFQSTHHFSYFELPLLVKLLKRGSQTILKH